MSEVRVRFPPRKGRDLFPPVRVAITSAVSGPELEKLIPIFEAGSKLPLARHVKSVSERLGELGEAAELQNLNLIDLTIRSLFPRLAGFGFVVRKGC